MQQAQAAAAKRVRRGISPNFFMFRFCGAAGVAVPGVAGGHWIQGHRGREFIKVLGGSIAGWPLCSGLEKNLFVALQNIDGVALNGIGGNDESAAAGRHLVNSRS